MELRHAHVRHIQIMNCEDKMENVVFFTIFCILDDVRKSGCLALCVLHVMQH